MLQRRLIADYDLLDVLTEIIQEKQLSVPTEGYRRLITNLAMALCEEFGGSVEYVSTNDEPAASIHLEDVQPESVWGCYGDEEV